MHSSRLAFMVALQVAKRETDVETKLIALELLGKVNVFLNPR